MGSIKHYFLTGDTHGAELLIRLFNLRQTIDEGIKPSSVGIIILGDVGLNYYLDGRDKKLKKKANSFGYQIYCVRGNHEARPKDIETMVKVYDEEVQGIVYYEPNFPNIKYFQDFGEYKIFNYKIAVIGGAYSVDKEYRLLNGWQWFCNEQLSLQEQEEAFALFKDEEFDLVLSHSCPYAWRPTDLFLSFIDQSKVDTTTEVYLENLKEMAFKSWGRWAFGHYHDDRLVRPGAIMLYRKIISLDEMMGDHMALEGFVIDPKYNN